MTKICREVNLLIADDSMISRKSLRKYLKLSNYKITEAADGKEAVELVENNNFDVVLLDLLMPHMTGIEVLEYFQKNGIKVPVIVISADIQSSTKELCMNYGAAAFLNKPPAPTELILTIEKNLKNSKGN